MKYRLSFIITLFLIATYASAQTEAEKYEAVLTERADKIVKTLDLKDDGASQRVVAALVAQYKGLGEINDNSDAAKKVAKQKTKDKTQLEQEIKNIENETNAKLFNLQCVFIGNLAVDLTNDQIVKVKDGMTYGVVKVTYDSYLDMIPSLKADEKRQLYAWLVEAREHAVTASSSKDKHGWFGKYKGRINNYLSKQGYDVQKERQAWEERVKARGGRL